MSDSAARRLVDAQPRVPPDELVRALVPPPHFQTVRFDTYVPAAQHPSQAAALAECREFVDGATPRPSRLARWFGRARETAPRCLYLDGGFGVGKTHLLASIWHAMEGHKAFGTFVELTNLVGALGFHETVRKLSGYRLLAIDEFELDDPGDTMLITRMLTELTEAGVRVAATSNTLPDRLGQERFAAEDFLREIHAMARRFHVVRIDGPDYRHRAIPRAPEPVAEAELFRRAEADPAATVDDFDELCAHLARIHPSRYGWMLDGTSTVYLCGVRQVVDQSVALRLVALADRLYDRTVPVVVSGSSLSDLFSEEMLRGGYRKKYLRALSRLASLAA